MDLGAGTGRAKAQVAHGRAAPGAGAWEAPWGLWSIHIWGSGGGLPNTGGAHRASCSWVCAAWSLLCQPIQLVFSPCSQAGLELSVFLPLSP
jgi:hypothetical protein